MAKCVVCGTDYGFFERQNGVCQDCKASGMTRERWEAEVAENVAAASARIHEQQRRSAEQEAAAQALRDRAAAMILTTESAPDGMKIERRLGIVTAECAFGMNVFKDIFTIGRDLVGGRSSAIQSTLKDARNAALDDLKSEAAALGADAVIAVDLDYSEFSGGGKSMLFLVASGTAVKLTGSPPATP